MAFSFTATQIQRLTELDVPREMRVGRFFETERDREMAFRDLHGQFVSINRERLNELRTKRKRPAMRTIESTLVDCLTNCGFVEVVTPITLSKGMLAKMGVNENHPLWEQVFWVSGKTCLRPMLAPNLYHLMGYLPRSWPFPIRFFEVGPCFRKESKGSRHLPEFTMLNLVEMGIEGDPQSRLEALAQLVMGALHLDYRVKKENSHVYGTTTDIMVGETEVASGACGPHPLDANWNVADNWIGLGLGIERLAMITEGFHSIRRAGRSLIYLDGARLNI